MRTSPQGASQPSSCPYPGCQRKRGAGSSLPRQTLLLTARLHFQEGNKRGHLILHSLQANELCELPLDLGERTRSNLRSWLHLLEPFSRRSKRPPEPAASPTERAILRPDYAKPGEEVFNRTRGWLAQIQTRTYRSADSTFSTAASSAFS